MLTPNHLQRRALRDLFSTFMDHRQAIEAALNDATPDKKLIQSVTRQLSSAEAIILKAYKKSLES